MKIKTTIVSIGLSASFASAYTVTLSNESVIAQNSPNLPILDNTGTPISAGVVAIGFFGSDSDVTDNSLDFTALLSGFTEYGSSVPYSVGSAPGLLNFETPSNWSVSVPQGTTGGQVGQNVFVVVGEGSTIENSQTLAVWKTNTLFGTEDDLGNGGIALDLSTGRGDLLLGDDGGLLSLAGGAVTFPNTIQLVAAIPEPSTSLLAALAGLGLVARRRR